MLIKLVNCQQWIKFLRIKVIWWFFFMGIIIIANEITFNLHLIIITIVRLLSCLKGFRQTKSNINMLMREKVKLENSRFRTKSFRLLLLFYYYYIDQNCCWLYQIKWTLIKNMMMMIIMIMIKVEKQLDCIFNKRAWKKLIGLNLEKKNFLNDLKLFIFNCG